jgi:endogenous inhibitor of DNA gyrase (YacG/DUF329 family)
MVTFNCPHCGEYLEASEEDDGLTLPCPRCDRPVTLVADKKKLVAATIVAGGLGLLASWLGLDD